MSGLAPQLCKVTLVQIVQVFGKIELLRLPFQSGPVADVPVISELFIAHHLEIARFMHTVMIKAFGNIVDLFRSGQFRHGQIESQVSCRPEILTITISKVLIFQ